MSGREGYSTYEFILDLRKRLDEFRLKNPSDTWNRCYRESIPFLLYKHICMMSKQKLASGSLVHHLNTLCICDQVCVCVCVGVSRQCFSKRTCCIPSYGLCWIAVLIKERLLDKTSFVLNSIASGQFPSPLLFPCIPARSLFRFEFFFVFYYFRFFHSVRLNELLLPLPPKWEAWYPTRNRVPITLPHSRHIQKKSMTDTQNRWRCIRFET